MVSLQRRFFHEFVNGRYYTAEAGKKIIIMKRIFWLVYRLVGFKVAGVVGFAREKTVDFLLCCCFIVTEFQVLWKKLKREPRVSRGRTRRCNREQISRCTTGSLSWEGVKDG